MIEGTAKDGATFNAGTAQVKAYMEKYPDVTLEAAIGSCVMEYEKELEENKEVE